MSVRSALVATLLVISTISARAGYAEADEPRSSHLFFKCRLIVIASDGKTIPDAIIEANGGVILNVGAKADLPIPRDAKVVDFSEKYIIPGLVDTHGHLYSRTASTWTPTNAL